MPSLDQLKELGRTFREARKSKKLTLEELEELSGVSKNYVWIIESAYVGPNRSPTVPADDKLAALGKALDIPVSHLHTILGRHDAPNTAAVALVREVAGRYGNGDTLGPERVQEISEELEEIATVRVGRAMKQLQGAR